jgi:exopolyphosphatase/pppGpp-phosphohydrolase
LFCNTIKSYTFVHPIIIKNMKKQIRLSVYSLLFTLFFSYSMHAQGVYGGIEIGSKGIKMSVIDVENVKKSIYQVKDFWTENAGIARGISIDGNLMQEDIDNACAIVLKNYQKMLTEYKVEDKNIFIVASSGVGMAKNTDILAQQVKKLTNKEMDLISSQLEAKLMLKGCIPPKYYQNSIILDIGGGNTKGGYVDSFNESNIIFFPVSLDLGTITLTEKINLKAQQKTVFEFNELSFDYLPTLREKVGKMYENRPQSFDKNNIYLSGGAVWAFYTLFNGKAATENFTEIKFEDIVSHKFSIENSIKKYENIALTDRDVEKVLKTYSQKHLISANNLLVSLLESIPNIEKKKLFFAKQGQIAWLLAYVADRSKGIKPIY